MSEALPADDGECTDNLNDSDVDPGELEDGKPHIASLGLGKSDLSDVDSLFEIPAMPLNQH